MWKYLRREPWSRAVLVLVLICLTACSAQRKDSSDDMFADTNDPFSDSFFTDPPDWDNTTLQQSEVLGQAENAEPEEPKSWLEWSGEALFATLLVGGSLAKLALPFLGL